MISTSIQQARAETSLISLSWQGSEGWAGEIIQEGGETSLRGGELVASRLEGHAGGVHQAVQVHRGSVTEMLPWSPDIAGLCYE